MALLPLAPLLLLLSHFFSPASAALPRTAPQGSPLAALDLLSSILQTNASSLISLTLTSNPCATLTGGGPSQLLSVQAASAVDAVHAIGQYLQATLNASFSWELTGGVQLHGLPAGATSLPAVPGGSFAVCRRLPYSYYMNVVQSSYSNVWWDAARWDRELAWMALKGVNVALAYGGQEALWRQVFQGLGLNDSTLGAYFGGPAYLSWSRGQGLQGVGGPLPPWWYSQQLALNQHVVARMYQLGIAPVLPVFQGNVPPALHSLFPAANISTDGWLDVFDPLFTRIQDDYMGLLAAAYPNTYHFYEADGLFSHASGPWARGGSRGSSSLGGASDAQARSRAAYASFAKHDPEAVWVYQSWIWRGCVAEACARSTAPLPTQPPSLSPLQHTLLLPPPTHTRSFSTPADLAYISAFLSGPPPRSWFLLDQTAEFEPIWAKFGQFSFNGASFAWLAMNNMGGNLGMLGSLQGVAQGVQAALQGSSGALVGVGIDPEGINTNPAHAEYTLQQAFEQTPDAAAFLGDWGVRRCGAEAPGVRAAWQLLAGSVYAPNQSTYEHHLHYCGPALPQGLGSGWDSPPTQPPPAVTPAALGQAWGLLLQAAPHCPAAAAAAAAAAPTPSGSGYAFDLVDIGREYLSLFPCLTALTALASADSAGGVAAAGAALQGVLADTDALLGTHGGFLFGGWVAEALRLGAAAGASGAELQLLELNARAQVTSWFPTPPGPASHLYDYGNKQWAGLTGVYYAQRYAALQAAAAQAVARGKPASALNKTALEEALTAIGAAWTAAHAPQSVFPEAPVGDPVQVAQALYSKYVGA